VAAIPSTIPQQLMEKIRQGVIVGRYAPGSALREEALESEYGASRGPVREALRLLELRGLATHRPRHGFRVREYAPKTVEDLYRLRAVLERYAVECLAGRDLSGLIAGLDASNARMRRHFKARRVADYLRENIAFHRLIIGCGGNEALQRTLEVLNEMAEPLRYAILDRSLRKSRSLDDHVTITDLLRRGRLQAAAATAESHILDNLPAVLEVSRKL
jgi:DNA-binding GntR family transcriptional regulator